MIVKAIIAICTLLILTVGVFFFAIKPDENLVKELTIEFDNQDFDNFKEIFYKGDPTGEFMVIDIGDKKWRITHRDYGGEDSFIFSEPGVGLKIFWITKADNETKFGSANNGRDPKLDYDYKNIIRSILLANDKQLSSSQTNNAK